MKKTKKFLTVAVAAVMMASMGSVSASAMFYANKIYCSVRLGDQTTTPDEFSEFMVDENGAVAIGSTYNTKRVVVKMADGFELEADESRYEMEKLSKYQIKKLQKEYTQYIGCWGSIYDIFDGVDFDVNDNYYILNFDQDPDDGRLFCNEILESGRAVFAKPIFCMRYNEAGFVSAAGYDYSDYLKENGVDADSSEFIEGSFGFTLTFDSEEKAKSFETDSIVDFNENLNACKTKDNVMYFQFKRETDSKIMGNVLCALQNSEEVKEIGMMSPINLLLSVGGGSIGGIPKDYPLGDTDYNNKIDLFDAINIAKHMGGIEELDELRQILADYNEDGKIDLQDAIGIAKYMSHNRNKK